MFDVLVQLQAVEEMTEQTFTDDDLERLKEHLRTHMAVDMERSRAFALLARLEAAEECVRQLWWVNIMRRRILDKWADGDEKVKQHLWQELHQTGEGAELSYEAWRKISGKASR